MFAFASATIGCGGDAALQIPGAGVQTWHARILHVGGCFWLENLAPPAQTVGNEQLLHTCEWVPLQSEVLAMLRAHGLLKKVPRTQRYLIQRGVLAITAILAARQAPISQLATA
jgi:hypothetical protein